MLEIKNEEIINTETPYPCLGDIQEGELFTPLGIYMGSLFLRVGEDEILNMNDFAISTIEEDEQPYYLEYDTPIRLVDAELVIKGFK